MSDWVKTPSGWKQSSGNGVSREELNEVKDSLTQKQNKSDDTLTTTDKTVVGGINELKQDLNTLEHNMDTVLPLASKILFSDNIETFLQRWVSNSNETYYEIEIKLKQADYLGNKFYNIRINVTAKYLGVWSGVTTKYEQNMFVSYFNV